MKAQKTLAELLLKRVDQRRPEKTSNDYVAWHMFSAVDIGEVLTEARYAQTVNEPDLPAAVERLNDMAQCLEDGSMSLPQLVEGLRATARDLVAKPVSP